MRSSQLISLVWLESYRETFIMEIALFLQILQSTVESRLACQESFNVCARPSAAKSSSLALSLSSLCEKLHNV